MSGAFVPDGDPRMARIDRIQASDPSGFVIDVRSPACGAIVFPLEEKGKRGMAAFCAGRPEDILKCIAALACYAKSAAGFHPLEILDAVAYGMAEEGTEVQPER